ncbi:MAG: NAD(P)-dependent oxidoreductase [Chloroflexi bacterium]|nr:NAD(P)-dependent oxidoreductase [Chloroflexota bacterium]
MNIGFVGLGALGQPMARRLLAKGRGVVGYNRSPAKQQAFVGSGGLGAKSLREVAQGCDVVHTCLTSPPDSDAVYLGRDGLLAHARPGQVFVEHSTISVGQARRLEAAARERGAYLLDAPVSGGPPLAAEGKLTLMVGGDEEVYQRVKSVLDDLASRVFLVGPVGSGMAVKLANALMMSINMAGIVEGLVLVAKFGVPPKAALEIFKESTASSRVLMSQGPVMVNRDFPDRPGMKFVMKDLGLALAAADEAGVRTLVGRITREVFNEACLAGYADKDWACVVRPLEDLAGMTLG